MKFLILVLYVTSITAKAVEVRTAIVTKSGISRLCVFAQEQVIKSLKEELNKLGTVNKTVEIGKCEYDFNTNTYEVVGKIYELSQW